MRDRFQSGLFVELVDLVGAGAAIDNDAAEADRIVALLGLDRGHDPVHGENRVEIVGRHDQGAVGVL